MEHFDYVRAKSIPEALAFLNDPGKKCRPLAGGTDLMLITRHEPVCDRVVDITQIPEMHEIKRQGDRVVIGAGAVFREVIENPIVQETAPVLVQACSQIGAVQIRNMGTLGGNVANAAACADSLPALVCLNAVARILTPDSEIEFLVSDFVRSPNKTQLPAGGLLVSLSYTIPAPNSRSVFLKLGRRNAMAISRLTVAALGRIDNSGHIAEARVVPGSASPQIVHFVPVEELLLGKTPDPQLFAEAGQLAIKEMARLSGRRWSSEFKEPALETMVSRALTQVFC